jgi:hypothetical protein
VAIGSDLKEVKVLLKIELSDGSSITSEWDGDLHQALEVLTGTKRFVELTDEQGVLQHVNRDHVVSLHVVRA